MKYAFVLGREPALSTAELIARLRASSVGFEPKNSVFSREILIADVAEPLTADFFHALGGSIKMAEVLGASERLESDLFNVLNSLGGASVDFGLSLYSLETPPNRTYHSLERGLKPMALELKKKLKENGRAVRAVIPDETALSSVQVEKNKLTSKGAELLILVGGGTVFIAKTIAVQAFEEFSARDFGRPGRDAKSGMLPPKLARMMINLSGAPKDQPLLDPFCGSGTILSEAALLGYADLTGSDISERAVQDTRTNFDWTMKRAGAGIRFSVFQSDVKFLPEKLKPASVAAVVTEPFLGPPLTGKESDQKIHFVFLELMGLYRRAFAAFAKILKPGGAVVFIFPFFDNKHVNILRELEELGFYAEGLLPGKAVEALGAKSSTGLSYKRENQRVGRDIFKFRFKG